MNRQSSSIQSVNVPEDILICEQDISGSHEGQIDEIIVKRLDMSGSRGNSICGDAAQEFPRVV